MQGVPVCDLICQQNVAGRLGLLHRWWFTEQNCMLSAWQTTTPEWQIKSSGQDDIDENKDAWPWAQRHLERVGPNAMASLNIRKQKSWCPNVRCVPRQVTLPLLPAPRGARLPPPTHPPPCYGYHCHYRPPLLPLPWLLPFLILSIQCGLNEGRDNDM